MSRPAKKPIFQFKDDVIDPADLEIELRQRLDKIPAEKTWWPRYGVAASKQDLTGEAADQLITYHLQNARHLLLNQPDFASERTAPSPVTRLPVIGKMWGLMRQQAHALVVFYIDRQRAHQAEINHHLLEAITALEMENSRLRNLLGFESDPTDEW